MNGPNTTHASLMARLHQASCGEDVWEDFVRIYGPHVIRWCRGHGLQETDAHDVSQDVLIRFWRHSQSFCYDPQRSFRGYLRRMVLTAVADWADQLNRQRRGGDVRLNGLLDSVPARDDLATRIEQAYDTELLAIAMRDVEHRVQPHTWLAFRLLAIERKAGAEVARELGMEVNTAYVARKKVQRMIRETITALDAGRDPEHAS
jgi:RNA polymerase sigma-70 factor (ECF subfamily)